MVAINLRRPQMEEIGDRTTVFSLLDAVLEHPVDVVALPIAQAAELSPIVR